MSGLIFLLTLAGVIYLLFFSAPKTKKAPSKNAQIDRKAILQQVYPGLLDAFEEAISLVQTHWTDLAEYKLLRRVTLIDDSTGSCFRVQLEFYEFSTTITEKYFKGWEITKSDTGAFVYKRIYPITTTTVRDVDSVLYSIAKIHPEWRQAGNHIFFDIKK